MVRITRDKAELVDVAFVTFMVYRTPKDGKTICGYHEFSYQAAENRININQTAFGVPVSDAFRETRHFAETRNIPAIWINDPDRLFELELP